MADQIHMFDPKIYPRKLFVVKGKNKVKCITSAFCTPDKEELDVSDVDTAGATTYPNVAFRDNGWLGVLVWIREDRRPKSLAHEAVHVVNAIFKQTGVDVHYEHDEHYAYMLGWVVDCLWQVATNKFKDGWTSKQKSE